MMSRSLTSFWSKATKREKALSVALIIAIVFNLLTVAIVFQPPKAPVRAAVAGAAFDHIVTIMMENQGLCDIYTGCGGSGTYESSLADTNVLVRTWGTIGHNSQPNYIALLGAFDDSSTNGDGVCCYFESQPNLVDRMETAGLTWQAFAESAGSSGACSFSPPRSGDHFPFIDFSDMNTASRCSHFLTTSASSDTEFLAALNSATPANFIWLTPTDNNNGHDTGVSGGDNFLKALVPKILASSTFTGTRATLLILYDEGYTNCSNTGGTGECLYASFSGPVAKKGVQISPAGASHYSYLSTIEANWNLPSLNSNDAGAPNMMTAFGSLTPDFSMSASPTSLSFQSGGSGTSTISASGIGGFTSVVSLSIPSQTGISCNLLSASVLPGASTSLTCSSSTVGAYTVTVNGVSGALTHSTTVRVTVSVVNANYPNCGAPTKITLAQFVAGTLNLVPDMRMLNPPCSTYYELDNMGPIYAPYTGDCGAIFPSQPNLCDIHYDFSGSCPTLPAGCLFEVDQTWLNAGFTYPTGHAGGFVSATGFFNIDSHGTHELHPVATLTIVSTPPPTQLAASLSFSPSSPVVGQTVTFTATVTGGTPPYTMSLNYGDGVTATTTPFTHAYAATGTYTVLLTVTDSVGAKATSRLGDVLTVSAAPPPTGTFDNTWFTNNCDGAGTGTEAIVNGVLQLREQSPSGSDSNYAYCSTQRGTFPWGATQGTALPSGITSVSSTVNFLTASLTSGSRYHLFIALYYQLPSGTSCPAGGVGANGACWLDVQSRVVWVNGAFEPVGTVETYTSQAIGYGLASAIIQPGSSGTLTANVASLCQADLAAWNLPTTTTCTFSGVEIGTEGFQFAELDTNWPTVTFSTGTAPRLLTDFAFSPSSPQAGQTVTFTSTTSGGTSPYIVAWTFGDGSTGTGTVVTHTYSAGGSFTVTLTTKDSSNPQQTATSAKTIIVTSIGPPLLATSFTFTPTSPANGTVVTFTSTISGGTTPYTVTWTFGDGGTAAGPTVTHSYPSGGTFTVTETAKDSGSPQQTATSSKTVTVTSTGGGGGGNKFQLSVQIFDADGGHEETLAVNGRTVSSFPSVDTTANAQVFKTFNFNITSFVVSGTNTAKFTHASFDCPVNDNLQNFIITQNGAVIFSDPAVHTFNCTTPVTYTFTVGAPPPPPALTASFTFTPATPSPGQTVTFTGTASGGTSPYTFTWAFGDGGATTGPTVTHVYTSAGSFTVTLTVKDSQSVTVLATKIVTVATTALSASFTFSPSTPTVGQTVTFAASATGGTSPYTFAWAFNDGTTGTGQTVTHAFPAGFDYNVTLTVTDAQPKTFSITNTVSISPPPTFTASFTWSPLRPHHAQTVTFTTTITGGVGPYTVTWNFGDGITGTGVTATHAFANKGIYLVTMTVTDSVGETVTVTTQLTVRP